MRIRRGKVRFEQVLIDAEESFAVRQFRSARFSYGWHSHPELELTLIVKGRGVRSIGDSIASFDSGDLCFLGSGLPHTWQSDLIDGAVDSLIVQFLPAVLGESFGKLREMKKIAAMMEQAARGLEAPRGPTHEQVVRTMQRLVQTPRGSARRIALLIEALSLLAEGPALHPLSLTAFADSRDRRTQGVMGKILDRIHDDRDEDKSQARMAKIAGLSPQSFSRFFKAQMGRSYVSYLNEWRISRACRLLAESAQDITTIAFASGFNNLSNFNRRFLDTKGVCPRDYRRKVSESLEKETS